MGITELFNMVDFSLHFQYENGRILNAQSHTFADNRLDKDGYRIVSVRGQNVGAHRLIWFMHHGSLPEEVDHINGDRADNRIENLRASTHRENCRNRKTYSSNTSGKKGVYYHEGKKRWQVYVDGKMVGSYYTKEHASKMRDYYAKKAHGEFYREDEPKEQSHNPQSEPVGESKDAQECSPEEQQDL